MQGDKELIGTLRGFDMYVNMVLEDVEEVEVTAEGPKLTKLPQILLNGNNIALLVPGGPMHGQQEPRGLAHEQACLLCAGGKPDE